MASRSFHRPGSAPPDGPSIVFRKEDRPTLSERFASLKPVTPPSTTSSRATALRLANEQRREELLAKKRASVPSFGASSRGGTIARAARGVSATRGRGAAASARGRVSAAAPLRGRGGATARGRGASARGASTSARPSNTNPKGGRRPEKPAPKGKKPTKSTKDSKEKNPKDMDAELDKYWNKADPKIAKEKKKGDLDSELDAYLAKRSEN